MNQSERGNTGDMHQARENKQVTMGFGSTSDLVRKWRLPNMMVMAKINSGVKFKSILLNK